MHGIFYTTRSHGGCLHGTPVYVCTTLLPDSILAVKKKCTVKVRANRVPHDRLVDLPRVKPLPILVSDTAAARDGA